MTVRLARQLAGQRRFPFSAPAEVERAQRRRVMSVVSHAYETVPYYRETMRRLGLRLQDFQTADDLGRLPILERDEIQRDPEAFVSRSEPLESYLRIRSGGSSGAPRQIFYDARSVIDSGAYAERHRSVVRKLAGRRLRLREAIIESPFGTTRSVHQYLARHVALAPTLAIPRRYVSLLDPPEVNLAALESFRPDVLEGYGSYLDLLFPYMQSTGVQFGWPRVVVFGSDAMSDTARQLITGSFGIPVVSAYGAVEAFQIGFECEHGLGYHLNVDLVPLRIVGPDGRDQQLGESGEVVISNLANRATVLLNYRLGDVAHIKPAPCPCGRTLPLLSFLEGRADDWIQRPSGETVHPQAVRTLFTDEDGILQYQVRQLAPGRFEVDVVATAGIDRDEMRARLADKFVRRIGSGTATEIFFVDAVARTEGGKVRAVVRA